jgi:hypothetical protein
MRGEVSSYGRAKNFPISKFVQARCGAHQRVPGQSNRRENLTTHLQLVRWPREGGSVHPLTTSLHGAVLKRRDKFTLHLTWNNAKMPQPSACQKNC